MVISIFSLQILKLKPKLLKYVGKIEIESILLNYFVKLKLNAILPFGSGNVEIDIEIGKSIR